MKRRLKLVATFCISVLLNGTAGAQVLGALRLPYSDATPITLGSGVDVDLIDQQRSACLDFTDDDIKWLDTSGATHTSSTIELMSDYKSLAESLRLEVDYKSKGDVSIASLKAGGSVQLHSKYEQFSRDESHSLAIVVKASSSYGRHGLRDYKLKDDIQQLINSGKNEEFRARCGTHTVVAENRQSMVSAVILVTNLSRTSKTSLEGLYKTTISAGGSIDAGKLATSNELTLKWKNLINTASKLGSLKVSFESKGGAGISDATKLAVANNPQDITPFLTALNTVGGSFTQESSAPTGYLLISNSAFGAKNKAADVSKLDVLNGYFEQLAKIDYAMTRVKAYETSFPAVYSKIYAAELKKIAGVRTNLVGAVESCVVDNKCDYVVPKDLGILYLEDLITADSLELDCAYRTVSISDASGQSKSFDVLSGVSVNLLGRLRLAEFVSVDNAIIGRFGPDSQTMQATPGFVSVSVSSPNSSGTARIAATLDYKMLAPDVMTSSGTVIVKNLDEITATRNALQDSIYGISIQAKNGATIVNTVGPAYGGNCPLTRSL